MIHLPPLLCDVDFESPSQMESGAEIAAEATDFFDSIEYSSKLLEVSHHNVSEGAATPTTSSDCSILCGAGEPSWEIKSLSSIRSMIKSKDNKINLKLVPKMNQKHFIMLWKTLYDMFQTQPDDQETYRSIATVGEFSSPLFN